MDMCVQEGSNLKQKHRKGMVWRGGGEARRRKC